MRGILWCWRWLTAAFVVLAGCASAQNCPQDLEGLVLWSDKYGHADPNSEVRISSGEWVLYDVVGESPVYAGIVVDGGVLVFQDIAMTLHTHYLIVLEGGGLYVGSECCPIQSKMNFVLHGDSSDADPYGVGTKVIGLVGAGLLEMHGAVRSPTWTQLSSTAKAGDTTIKLAAPVGWAVGDVIVIASTDFDLEETEQKVVKAISGDGTTITLDSALKYMHFGEIVDGIVDERAEVGLLTRNIVVSAANDSGTAQSFGCHMMFRDDIVGARIGGVELVNCGQAGYLARYPFHFHLTGDVLDKGYGRDLSVHHSFQRCVTYHGTHNLTVTRTVAYETFGHCFYVEDGIEEDNVGSYNLVINARNRAADDPDLIIPSDVKAACYWITNPKNTFVSNHAAGCEMGYWYALPENPISVYSDMVINNRRIPLQKFEFNVAHTIRQTGLMVDEGLNADQTLNFLTDYNPVECPVPCQDPDDPTKTLPDVPVPAHFKNFTAYKCSDRGAWLRGQNVRVEQGIFADNAIGATLAMDMTDPGYVTESIFYCDTPNIGSISEQDEPLGGHSQTLPKPQTPSYPIRGFEFYEGPVINSNCRFHNCVPDDVRNASALSTFKGNLFFLSTTNYIEEFQMVTDNGDRLVFFTPHENDADWNAMFVDKDGSVTSRPDVAVVNSFNPLLSTPSCIDQVDWNAKICPKQYGVLSIYTHNSSLYTWTDSTDDPVVLFRDDVEDSISFCGTEISCPRSATDRPSNFTASVVLEHSYYVAFPAHSPPTNLTLELLFTDQYNSDPGDQNFVIVKLCYPPSSSPTITYNGVKTTVPAATEVDLANDLYDGAASNPGDGLWYYNSSTGVLEIKVVPSVKRTSQTLIERYPSTQVFVQMSLPSGSTSPFTCTHTPIAPLADAGLPGVKTVGAPPAFGPSDIPSSPSSPPPEDCQDAFVLPSDIGGTPNEESSSGSSVLTTGEKIAIGVCVGVFGFVLVVLVAMLLYTCCHKTRGPPRDGTAATAAGAADTRPKTDMEMKDMEADRDADSALSPPNQAYHYS